MSDELIKIVNQLQDLFSLGDCSVGIDLPQIVVVGTQSAGKGSVLEHIVGKSFLPQGTGVVTRCPLVLQMVHAPDKTEEYAVFQHDSTQIFTDYNLIRKGIEEQTNKLAGTNNGICHKPITLKIFSPSLLNLTLVDLPELTTIPLDDQSSNIEKQTRDWILDFIGNPNSIILVVTSANVNIANCNSLQVARQVNPRGTRTLAVVTKLDLMEEGIDSSTWKLLLHDQIRAFRLGTIGVYHQTQTNIHDNNSIKGSLMDEAEFLQKNFKNIAAKHGSWYLTRALQALLVKYIKKCMPGLKESICKKIVAKKTEFFNYKKYETDDPNLLLLNLITKFANYYILSVKGHLLNTKIESDLGLAKINYIFHEVFAREIWSHINFFSKENITSAITKARGMHRSISVPEAAFEHLAKTLIEQFRNPSLMCVKLVQAELNNIAQICLEEESLQIHHYQELKSVLSVEVAELIQSCLEITNRSVNNFIDIQIAHINTSHPDFHFKQKQPVEVVDNDRSVSHLVMKSLECYMTIVCKIVEDTVQKTIMHLMVNSVVDRLLVELVRQVHRIGDVEDLLQESTTIISKRNELTAEITVLEEAVGIINTFKNID